MPFINTMTNAELNDSKKEELKKLYGTAITTLGKSENWLMLNFSDKCDMWFKGKNDSKMAMVEVSLFGSASDSQYFDMTSKITNAVADTLGIFPEYIYVKYEETPHWGWNGSNF